MHQAKVSSRKFRRVTQRIFYLQTFRCNSWMEWNWGNWSEGFALTCTLSSSHLMKNMRQKVIGSKHISRGHKVPSFISDCRQSGARTVVLAPFFSVCSNRSPKMIKKSILSSLSYRFFEASLLVFLDSCRQR